MDYEKTEKALVGVIGVGLGMAISSFMDNSAAMFMVGGCLATGAAAARVVNVAIHMNEFDSKSKTPEPPTP